MSTTNTTHYLGIALGPLVDTLNTAQKTRELWAASYLFSTLMNQLVDLTESPQVGGEVLAPTKVHTPANQLFGAGVYPDRYYAAFTLPIKTAVGSDPAEINIKAKQKEIFDTLQKLAIDQTVLAALPVLPATVAKAWKESDQQTSLQNYWRDIATDFFEQYFRITHVWLPAPAAGVNILTPLNNLLDVQELQPAYQAENLPVSPLLQLLDKPYSSKMVRNGLVRTNNSAFSSLVGPEKRANKKGPTFEFFPSTAQIASLDLFQKDEKNKSNYYQDLLAAIVKDLNTPEGDEINSPTPPGSPELLKKATQQPEEGEEPPTLPEDLPYQQGTDDANANAAVLQEFYRQLDNKGPETSATALAKHYEEYHKYFCVVDADGDRFGKIITAVGDTKAAIQHFSSVLARFAAKAAKIINAFGGKPIYIGGDDLLFFAPVVSSPNKKALRECEINFTRESATVFDVIDAIDVCFGQHDFFPEGKAPTDEKELPSLSYGLTLSHYKYPLFEARAHSLKELYRSKNTKWGPGLEKNAISFRLIRHSGSYFSGSMNKDILKTFNQKRSDQLKPGEQFLSSFTYKLRELEPLLRALDAVAPPADLPDRQRAVFDNFFDEEIHKDNPLALASARKLFQTGIATSAEVYGTPLDTYDNLYAILRLLAFTLPAKNNA